MKMNGLKFLILYIIFMPSFLFAAVADYLVIDGHGPYGLSNTNPVNVKVTLGKEDINPIDYNLKPESASVYFINPPAKGKIVRIVYDIQNISKKNQKLTFGLTKENEKIGIIDGTYKDSFMGGDLGMKVALRNTGEGASGENFGETLSYSKKIGSLTLGATYTDTGDNLAETDQYSKENDLIKVLAAINEKNISLDSAFVKYDNTGNISAENRFAASFGNRMNFSFKNIREYSENSDKYENVSDFYETGLAYNFSDRFKLSSVYRSSKKINTASAGETGISLYARPFAGFDVNYSLLNRSGQNDTKTDVSYRPSQKYNFGLNYSDTDRISETKASMFLNPFAPISFTVNYLNRELAEDSRFSHLKLTGNYKVDRFNIYGLFVDRKGSEFYEDTKSARLTYELFKFLELSSQWTENPENGELYTDATQYNFGMKLKFASLGISGNVFENRNALNIRDSQKFDIGLSASVFGGSLSGNVIYNRIFGINRDFYRQYKLGFSKKIGNRFSLSLSGEYDERNLNSHGFRKEDVKGNLSMGVNF